MVAFRCGYHFGIGLSGTFAVAHATHVRFLFGGGSAMKAFQFCRSKLETTIRMNENKNSDWTKWRRINFCQSDHDPLDVRNLVTCFSLQKLFANPFIRGFHRTLHKPVHSVKSDRQTSLFSSLRPSPKTIPFRKQQAFSLPFALDSKFSFDTHSQQRRLVLS